MGGLVYIPKIGWAPVKKSGISEEGKKYINDRNPSGVLGINLILLIFIILLI
jgi:hypothetical protein